MKNLWDVEKNEWCVIGLAAIGFILNLFLMGLLHF